MGLPETAGSPNYLRILAIRLFYCRTMLRSTKPGKGDEMKSLQGKPFGGSYRKRIIMTMMAIMCIVAPSVTQAEYLMFHAIKSQALLCIDSVLPKKEAVAARFLIVDQNGDFVIRHRNTTVVLAYNPTNDGGGALNYTHELRPRESAAANGMIVKIGFSF
jgi:hypothetical protein